MIQVITSKPIAVDSPDHTNPFGTANDNSVNPAFNRKLYELVPAKHVRLLDLGCAGGGLVKSILDDGGFAVGIEGSDYSWRWKRAEWPELGGKNLFTADVTEPFWVVEFEDDVQTSSKNCGGYNVVTAWEFFEHISEDKLPMVIDNIFGHLTPGGFLIGSISEVPSPVNGIEYHQTIHPKPWWMGVFAHYGLIHAPDLEAHFGLDVVRGPNEPGSFVIALRPYSGDHLDAND